MNNPSPQPSLDRYDRYVLDSFNAALASHNLPPVAALPTKRPELMLLQGGAE